VDAPRQTVPYEHQPRFDCRRMVREYMTELYESAHSAHLRMRKADYA